MCLCPLACQLPKTRLSWHCGFSPSDGKVVAGSHHIIDQLLKEAFPEPGMLPRVEDRGWPEAARLLSFPGLP